MVVVQGRSVLVTQGEDRKHRQKCTKGIELKTFENTKWKFVKPVTRSR